MILSDEQRRRRRQKNIALALALLALVAVFYVVTLVKLSANVS
jgi:predicted nucleic acid-binding Zn ribbon protein